MNKDEAKLLCVKHQLPTPNWFMCYAVLSDQAVAERLHEFLIEVNYNILYT